MNRAMSSNRISANFGKKARSFRSYVNPWVARQIEVVRKERESGSLDPKQSRRFLIALAGLHATYLLHSPFKTHSGDKGLACAFCSENEQAPVRHPCVTITNLDAAIEKGDI